MRSRRELAVAKALGMRTASVAAGVVFQAVAVTLLGFAIAVAAAFSVVPSIPLLFPQLTLAVSGAAVMRVGVVALLAAGVGAVLPAYAVSRVDPASTFQG
jgi:ABC-type antimicrobial peptide transport system permease subunit